MKALVTSFNRKLGLNPMCARLLHAIPGVEQAGVHDCDVVFLSFIAPECDFVPDKLLLDAVSRRRLPVIIFDHSETFPDNFILGVDSLPPGSNYNVIQALLDRELETKAYFKRELLTAVTLPHASFPVHPIDWTLQTNGQRHTPVSREFFEARPIDIFYCFGYSSESRPRLMGELLKQAGHFNAHWCLTEEDLDIALKEKRERRIFALLHVPHYRRIHIGKILNWQQQAKVSLSMFGAGRKCFRHAEASYNCVMGQQSPDEVQWSYPWVSGENCLDVPNDEDESLDFLHRCLRVNQGSLYDIYLAGVKNNENYHTEAYARDYLAPKIMEALK